MPMRFGRTSDNVVRESPGNAVKVLWTPLGSNTMTALNLVSVDAAWVVPEDTTVLMMGFTDELTAEFQALQNSGINGFTVPPTGDSDNRRLLQMAARELTTQDDRIGIPKKVSVIALHGSLVPFGSKWSPFGLPIPPLAIQTLLDKLPQIRELG
jgi:hypothetical protein